MHRNFTADRIEGTYQSPAKVIVRFWIITVILVLVGLSSLKIR